MAVEERLGLEAVTADTLIAVEHLHRYEFAAELCAGLRVVDLACGSGYGSEVLRRTAASVLGVDNDAATVDMARATVGARTDVTFEAADAFEFLCRDLSDDFDAIVCFEGLEHLRDPLDALGALARHAGNGLRLVISVPNSRAFSEENEFHVTDFGFAEALEAFRSLGDARVLYQFHAEGSLLREERPSELEGEFLLPEHGEPEYANHFIACVNLAEEVGRRPDSARMRLAVAPAYNRHMINLERSNRELWRENARISRHLLGKAGAAAATEQLRIQARAEAAEQRIRELELEIDRLNNVNSILDTPRHRAVEQTRDRVMRHPRVYRLVRRTWAALNRR
jgi:SAM-dependent methyltransferase